LYDTDITVDNLEDNINHCDNMNLSSHFKSVEVQTETYYSNEEKLKNKIKILQQKLRRKNKKIENLDDLVKSLKNDGHINSEQQHVILNNFNGKLLIFLCTLIYYLLHYALCHAWSDSASNLFKNELKNNCKGKV